jgi:hypothetical protein
MKNCKKPILSNNGEPEIPPSNPPEGVDKFDANQTIATARSSIKVT